jgi:hypothetical protein
MSKPSKLGNQGLSWMKPVESPRVQEQEGDHSPAADFDLMPESENISEQQSTDIAEPKSDTAHTSESVTVAVPKSKDAEPRKSIRAKESKRKELEPLAEDSIGAKIPKSKNPAWGKCSYYLESDILLRLQIHAARTRQDQSDIVNAAVKEWLDREGG